MTAKRERAMEELRYRWEDMESDRPLEHLVRRRIVGQDIMLSHVSLEAGCEVAAHSHDNEQMAVVLAGRIRFGLGAPDTPEHVTIVASAGDVVHLPSGLPHSAQALEDSVVLDVFSPPTEQTGIDRA